MKRLKNIISYFFEIILQKLDSKQSGNLVISLDKGQLKLSTDKVIYSFGKRYTSFKYAFEKINIQDLQIKNVLILGAGLGSIIELLENQNYIEQIDAIDNDVIIVEAAQHYLKTDYHFKINWKIDDAYEFVNTTQKQYDLILFDVFVHDTTPKAFLTKGFLLMILQRLRPNGIFIFSKMDTNFLLKKENQQFSSYFTEIFKINKVLNFSGNTIFVGYNR